MDKNNTPKSKFKQKNCYSEKLRKAKRNESNDSTSPRKTESEGKSPSKKSPKKGGGGGNFGHGSFPEYLAPVEVLRGLQNKTLIEGVLRINPKSYEDAFISSPEARDQDIYIKVNNDKVGVHSLINTIIKGYCQQKQSTEWRYCSC